MENPSVNEKEQQSKKRHYREPQKRESIVSAIMLDYQISRTTMVNHFGWSRQVQGQYERDQTMVPPAVLPDLMLLASMNPNKVMNGDKMMSYVAKWYGPGTRWYKRRPGYSKNGQK